MPAATIPFPWPDGMPSRYELIKATVLARATYGLPVAVMVGALENLGLDISVIRRSLVPQRLDGMWICRATLRWTPVGGAKDADSSECSVDLSDPYGRDASPEQATAMEDLTICAALDRLIRDYDRGAF